MQQARSLKAALVQRRGKRKEREIEGVREIAKD
jgi:hypothetical protein